MFKYVVKRVIAAIITLWALVTIVFFLVRLMPGDPFTSAKLTKEVAANMRSYYGFDKPLIQQYFTYLANLLHGNFGYSMKYTNKTVNYIIGQTFPYSADLGIRALVMAVSFGPGAWYYCRQKSWQEAGLLLCNHCDYRNKYSGLHYGSNFTVFLWN